MDVAIKTSPIDLWSFWQSPPQCFEPVQMMEGWIWLRNQQKLLHQSRHTELFFKSQFK